MTDVLAAVQRLIAERDDLAARLVVSQQDVNRLAHERDALRNELATVEAGA